MFKLGSKQIHRKLTVLFALAYGVAGLLIFIYLFSMFVFGYRVELDEPNVIIAASELISAVLAALLISKFILIQISQESAPSELELSDTKIKEINILDPN